MNAPHAPDQKLHAAVARLTGNVSPAGLATAWVDWASHLSLSPERQAQLWSDAQTAWAKALTGHVDPAHDDDPRFAHPLWKLPAYRLAMAGFLATQDWWHHALAPLPGVEPKHQQALNFHARQALDMASPSNNPVLNPAVLERAARTGGQSLIQGAKNWQDDLISTLTGKPRDSGSLKVGETLAITPGSVVYRNRLVELIRYTPHSDTVRTPPIFIVPAWIMKFYVLDLSQDNSLVRHLVEDGFEVLMLSWKNPDRNDAQLDLNDYLKLGIEEPLEWLRAERGIDRVHAVGYCLGGTLLSIAAAAAAREDRSVFDTLTLLASQTDFADPGELGIFITEAQVAFLEDVMADRGYLKADQMSAAFQMLRPADLIWSRVIRHYLLGQRTPMNDLMVWNADATRMPARMHATYLRKLFLENALANRTYRVRGHRISLGDIRAPIYCLGTESDHVSPWQSVFKLLALTDTDIRFVLTNGGHNGGVLSEPGHPGRHYRVLDKREGGRFVGPDTWLETTDARKGSWWQDWTRWLADRSEETVTQTGWPALSPAPGTYVFD